MTKMTQAHALQRYVGSFVQETLDERHSQLKTNIGLCEAVEHSGNCDDYEGTVKKLEDFKKDHTKTIRAIDRHIKVGQKQADTMAPGE